VSFYREGYKAETLYPLINLNPSETLSGQDMDLELGTTYTLNLKEGWNLISMPLVVDELTPLPVILYGLDGKYTRVDYWNAQTDVYEDYRVIPSVGHQNDFHFIAMHEGIWINMTEDASFVLSGVENNNAKNVHLYLGWNMVGYTFTSSESIASAITSNYDKINLIWRWNANTDDYELFDPWGRFTNEFTTFNPGYGYWVYADEEVTIGVQ
ncbi:MAG: hypothetical protein U9N35_07120, partial [Euryarchaeota archaeon]|nr:hypothetical protein [Euryarchaeota archaeon]